MATSDGSSLRQYSTPPQNGHSANGQALQNGNGKLAALNGNSNGNGNGHNGNGGGGGHNGNGSGGGSGSVPEAPQTPQELQFDRPVILKQTPVWAMAIIDKQYSCNCYC